MWGSEEPELFAGIRIRDAGRMVRAALAEYRSRAGQHRHGPPALTPLNNRAHDLSFLGRILGEGVASRLRANFSVLELLLPAPEEA